MARMKLPALAAASVDEVERAFYDAMQRGDIERLMAVWADDDEISCVHPGAPRMIGATAIRASYETMFAHGTIRAEPLHVRRAESHAIAVHSVIERVRIASAEGERFAYVIATNVWVRAAHGWRLLTHHASPGMVDEPDAGGGDSTMTSTLH